MSGSCTGFPKPKITRDLNGVMCHFFQGCESTQTGPGNESRYRSTEKMGGIHWVGITEECTDLLVERDENRTLVSQTETKVFSITGIILWTTSMMRLQTSAAPLH